MDWITSEIENVALVICAIIGVIIIAGAKKAKWGATMSTVGIVVVGLVLIVGPFLLVNFAEDASTGIAEAEGLATSRGDRR